MRTDPAREGAEPRLSSRQLWMLFILTLAVLLAFTDRSLLSILVDPIKQDLHISDVQMSVLLGLSFSVIYSLAAIPLGYLVDVTNRRALIATCVITWSAMTAYACFAHNFTELFISRMGLGVAEAALNPAAFSMIRDAFPRKQRGRAFAIYNASYLVGGGIALLVGGALLGFSAGGGLSGIVWLESLRPWQFVLLTVGAVGLPLGLVIFTVREPARGAASPVSQSSFAEAFRFIGRKKKLLIPFWGALALFSMAQGGISAWVPMAVHRTWSVAIPLVGKTLGPLQIVLALAGSFAMGWLMDHLSGKGRRDAPVITCAIAMGLAMLAALAQFFITDLKLAAYTYMIQYFLFTSFTIASSTCLAQITPSRLSGKVQSLTGLASSLLGLALGPTVVALVAEHVHSARPLHDALAATIVVTVAIGVVLYAIVAMQLRNDRDELQ